MALLTPEMEVYPDSPAYTLAQLQAMQGEGEILVPKAVTGRVGFLIENGMHQVERHTPDGEFMEVIDVDGGTFREWSDPS